MEAFVFFIVLYNIITHFTAWPANYGCIYIISEDSVFLAKNLASGRKGGYNKNRTC